MSKGSFFGGLVLGAALGFGVKYLLDNYMELEDGCEDGCCCGCEDEMIDDYDAEGVSMSGGEAE